MIARIASPAKINLGLEVLGKRADGYHEIRTILQMITLSDEVEVDPASEMSLTCNLPELAGEENLALAAARLWSDEVDPRHPAFALNLVKRIPMAAGLGGASSNAASVLLAADRLFAGRSHSGRLRELAARLGSDVPFFLDGPAALASGRGELLEPLPPLDNVRLVLATPAINIPRKTATMYAALSPGDFTDGEIVADARRSLMQGRPLEAGHFFNAFRRPLIRMYPKLESFLEIMRSFADGRADFTGAGPTLFALLDDETSAHMLVEELRKIALEARISIERPLTERPQVELRDG